MQSTLSAISTMFTQIGAYVPRIIAAIIILIVGLILANFLGKIITRLFKYTRIDALIEGSGAKQKMQLKFSISEILGWIVKWFLIILTLIGIAGTLNLPQLTQFLLSVAYYIPNVAIAVVIIALGLGLGNFLANLAYDTLEASRMSTTASNIIAIIVRWAIVIFAFMAAMIQLGIAPQLIQILFSGLVVMIALGGGLAFGLGGRNKAEEAIRRISEEMKTSR